MTILPKMQVKVPLMYKECVLYSRFCYMCGECKLKNKGIRKQIKSVEKDK